ncbi:MAG: phosphodiester glycosidase family protein [Rubinisphaera brasiliensis]|uniref:phosphodiester glycosidase family protein n=1 Tax=Rubinisphaera brasiliensis TaxID=119 RepID=UPI00391DD602
MAEPFAYRQQTSARRCYFPLAFANSLFPALAILAGTATFATAAEPLIVELNSRPAPNAESASPVLLWKETTDSPRDLAACFMRVELKHAAIEPVVMVGDDPDGDGPAEASLTMPLDLMNRHDALAGINANAFAKVRPEDRFRPWSEGMHVDVIGMAVSNTIVRSPLDNPRYSNSRTAFWIDARHTAEISRPGNGFEVYQAVGDFVSSLLLNGDIVPEPGGPRHPRSALGLDKSKRFLLLVVVDGRRPGHSDGVTLHELATLMKEQGCQQAINLDGGGSSIMLARDEGSRSLTTINRPSDGMHRPIPTMIGVRPKNVSNELTKE